MHNEEAGERETRLRVSDKSKGEELGRVQARYNDGRPVIKGGIANYQLNSVCGDGN